MRRLQSYSTVVPFNVPASVPAFPAATITLDFTGPSMPANTSFSRASSATYFDNTGTLQSVGNDVPRFDYHPVTKRYLGLLLENSATNLLLNSLFNGTNLSTQTCAVTSGQLYTISFWGTGTVTLSGAVALVVLGSPIANDRASQVFSTSTNSLTVTVSGTVKWAQLELTYSGASTSFIPTAGSPVTRAQEFAAITGAAAAILSQSQGSAVVTCSPPAQYYIGPSNILFGDANPGGMQLCDLDSSQTGNAASIAMVGTASWVSAYVPLFRGTNGTYVAPLQKIGMNWPSWAISVSGFDAGTSASPNVFTPSANYYVGYGSNGWYRSVALWATALNASQLALATGVTAPAINNGTPQGALDLGYSTQQYSLSPTLSDIAPDQTAGTHALYDGMYFGKAAPISTGYFMSSGALAQPFNYGQPYLPSGCCLTTQTRNSQAGTLGYLSGATGFYGEFTVALDTNAVPGNADYWPAVWFMPQEHDDAGGDVYTGAPFFDSSAYERWMELDCDEGGFGYDLTGSMIDWQGTWVSSLNFYYRDPPPGPCLIPGNSINNIISGGFLDRKQYHTFGCSYDPIQNVARWYIDDIMYFKAAAPAVAPYQHFYQIFDPQSHGANYNYTMFTKRIRAYTP